METETLSVTICYESSKKLSNKKFNTWIAKEALSHDFADGKGLIKLKKTVERITDKNGFRNSETLTSIVLPDSLTEIGERAFTLCKKLSSVIIPNSVTEICRFTFNGCSSLVSVVIPDSVKKIGDFAFYGCDNLSEETKERIRSIQKSSKSKAEQQYFVE